MKQRLISTLCLLFLLVVSMSARDIIGIVKNATTNERIGFASIFLSFSDSTSEACIADSVGMFKIVGAKDVLRIDVAAVGFADNYKNLSPKDSSEIVISLQPSSTDIQEVVVTAKRQLTKINAEGITYDMKADSRVKGENLLTALNKMPFVESKPDGTLTVRGSSNYLIYINGRPDDAAQNAKRTVLSTIKATDIDHVDIVTNATEKYGVAPGVTILNICTRGKVMDGFTLSTALGANTQPYTDDGVTLLVKKGNVDVSVDYKYNLNGQRRQPFTQEYTLSPASDVAVPQNIRVEGNGNGNVLSHTLRAMLQWKIDSINNVYADLHGLLGNTNTTTTSEEFAADALAQTYKRHDSNSSGTIEGNVIWRNYYKSNINREHFMLGYRYAYNPDHRYYYSTENGQNTTMEESSQRTKGGMHEHSITSAINLWLSPRHRLYVAAKGILRLGNTESIYSSGNIEDSNERMDYKQGIGQLSLYYSGSGGKFYWGGGTQLEQSHINMELPNDRELDYKRDNTNFLPYAYIYWMPSRGSQLSLTYNEMILRPSVTMLNPFHSYGNNYSGNVGNPQLKPQTTHSLQVKYYQALKQSVWSLSAEYDHSNNAILSYKYVDNGIVMSTYGNIGRTDKLSLSLFSQWNAAKWLSLSLSASAGHRWMTADILNLNQNNWCYTCVPQVDVFLPRNWNIQASYGLFKNLPGPFETISKLQIYSLSIVKSLLGGNMTISLVINSPFNKYDKSRQFTSFSDGGIVRQTNFITARSFGLNVYYSLHKGKKINLKRDTSLRNSDQQTGVQ